MIDWHSHVLPAMDDGSRDMAQSIALLKMQIAQGVDTVVATPHFHANDESVDHFLDRRAKACEALKGEISDLSLQILQGAEVRYYQGIARMKELKKLCIEDTKLLLLEMPFGKWTEYMVRELEELSRIGGLQIILAHVERYPSMQSYDTRERILQSGILMQVNASYFLSFLTKRKALSLLRDGYIHLLGSDCHNTESRPPLLEGAFSVIEKKMGREFLENMDQFGHFMLAQ